MATDHQVRVGKSVALCAMNVDQPLPVRGMLEQRVALARYLRKTCAQQQDQVGVLDSVLEIWIYPDPAIAGVVGMIMIEELLAAPGSSHSY